MIEEREILSDVELKNRLRNLPINDTGGFKLLDTFAIYLDNILFKSLTFKLKKLIESKIGLDKFDYICAVPPCGVPLSTSVSLITNKPLIMPLPQELHIVGVVHDFHSGSQIEQGKRILLVDTVINSGLSARATKQRLDSIDGKFVGLVVALFNDMFPDKRSDKFKRDEIEKINCLFKLSEIT